jgi:hypothetical protein
VPHGVRLFLILTSLAFAFAGCAGTRVGQVGRLPTGDRLVTVVLSDDRETVDRECGYPLAVGPVYGCQTTNAVALPDGRTARLIRLVRCTDALPSTMAFEIEVHELCHAVAALQTIDDPCHAENNGLIQTSRRR